MGKHLYCIDSGHAEETPGKRSPKFEDGSRLFEFEFNRSIVEKLTKRLKAANIDYFIVTPERVKDIGLTVRAKRVNELKTDKKKILISIHANAHGMGQEWTDANGWEVYTTPGVTKSDQIAELLFLAHKNEFPEFKMRSDKTDGDNDKEAKFTIIQQANCPAVLTENFFYTNKKEAALLKDDFFRERIAEAHFRAILAIEKLKL